MDFIGWFWLVVGIACWQREDNPPCAEFNQHKNAEWMKNPLQPA
jgi:hypothetical protein